jgi:aminoglycoside phosphotransferase (APT) family kinase protein
VAELLPGGFVSDVVRIGDTVRRPMSTHSDFVHELLGLFEQHGWTGAPRFCGVDEQGREVLSFVDGHVAWETDQPTAVRSDDSLIRVAELVREFHDRTACSSLAAGAEVVCHNDLSPKNTVYRDLGDGLRPVTFIDWDLAGPGARIHDVAHVCWQYIGLGPSVVDAAKAARQIRLIADSYGLRDRTKLVETIVWWQHRCRRGIEAAAEAGEPAMRRLRQSGAAKAVHADQQWVERHRDQMERTLT